MATNRVNANSEEIADFYAKRTRQAQKRFKGRRRFTGFDAGNSASLPANTFRKLCLGQASKLTVVTHQLSNLLFQTRHAP